MFETILCTSLKGVVSIHFIYELLLLISLKSLFLLFLKMLKTKEKVSHLFRCSITFYALKKINLPVMLK